MAVPHPSWRAHARHPPALPPRQLHHLVSDDVCLKVVELYLNEKKRGAAGGNLSSRCVRAARETSYQWKAERCMADENCFKVRGQPRSAPHKAGGSTAGAHDRSPVPCAAFAGPLDAGPGPGGHHRACEVGAQHVVPQGRMGLGGW